MLILLVPLRQPNVYFWNNDITPQFSDVTVPTSSDFQAIVSKSAHTSRLNDNFFCEVSTPSSSSSTSSPNPTMLNLKPNSVSSFATSSTSPTLNLQQTRVTGGVNGSPPPVKQGSITGSITSSGNSSTAPPESCFTLTNYLYNPFIKLTPNVIELESSSSSSQPTVFAPSVVSDSGGESPVTSCPNHSMKTNNYRLALHITRHKTFPDINRSLATR